MVPTYVTPPMAATPREEEEGAEIDHRAQAPRE
jgi:hypothetical protein